MTKTLVAAVLVCCSASVFAAEGEWKPLFNGKNLKGWSAEFASKPPENGAAPLSYFEVVDGEIHAYRDETAGTWQPNVYLITDTEHRDYRLSLEYRWGTKKFPPRNENIRDSGLLYHVHRARPNDWPASVESQIQEGDTGDLWAVSSQATTFVDARKRSYLLPEQGGVPLTVGKDGDFQRVRHGKVNEYPGWNTLEVIVRGDTATHIVNGVVNMRVTGLRSWDQATNSWVKLDHGRIALQAESAEVFFRNVKIRPVTPDDDALPKPKVTELWFPVPKKVTPGASAGAPPSDAVVLFDGKSLDAFEMVRGNAPAAWKIDNGEIVIAPGTGDMRTKAKFGDVQLHVEWRTPKLPADKVSQDRGNSGVFLQEVYEVQVLDSFTNETYVNGQAGSIYKQFPPLVNPTLAEENWQSYDIIFTAPRFGADGSLSSPARVTVLLNGVLVQNNAVLTGGTTYQGPAFYVPHGDGALRFQDHGHPVRFRNIWLRKL
jgi:hypothetical protein